MSTSPVAGLTRPKSPVVRWCVRGGLEGVRKCVAGCVRGYLIR